MKHWKSEIPAGEIGSAKIETFEVTPKQSAVALFSRQNVPPGTYTKLLINCRIIMSDTPDELDDHRNFIRAATGNILINGLGLGCVLNVTRHNDRVKTITVVEKNPDVIALVGPHFADDPKVNIIEGDAFTFKPKIDGKYDVAFHDIWFDICLDNLEHMKKLHRRYGRFAKQQFSWSRDTLERIRKQENRFKSWY